MILFLFVVSELRFLDKAFTSLLSFALEIRFSELKDL